MTNVTWALTDLRKAILIENVNNQRGIFRITERGHKIIKDKPIPIEDELLKSFSEYSGWVKSNINTVKRAIKKDKKAIAFKEGIIILLDVLGTKGKWKIKNNADISKLWNILTASLSDAVKNALIGKPRMILSFLTFSDTIMIIVETNDTKNILMKLASSLRAPLVVSMMIEMPLRGCISTGRFYRNKTLIIGPAIDEAAEYYDLPQWIGISASPSTNKMINDMLMSNQVEVNEVFLRCDVPLKNSVEQNAWALKWTADSDKVISETSASLAIKKSLKINYTDTIHVLNSHLEEENSLDVALKWRNTMKFYDSTLRK